MIVPKWSFLIELKSDEPLLFLELSKLAWFFDELATKDKALPSK